MTVVLELDSYGLADSLQIAAGFGMRRFGYVVTPNVDHFVRLHEDAGLREAYSEADYVLLDSRVLATLLKISRGMKVSVTTGSDLTAALFASVITPQDRIVVIGGTPRLAQGLAQRHGLHNLHHHEPPMGFLDDPAALEACLAFIEAHSPFRYCFLGVGSPRQELVARTLRRRGRARGLALCIGAALEFLGGERQRAPLWMQRNSLEWLHRLLQDPARLAHRYLVRGPRALGLLRSTRISVRSA